MGNINLLDVKADRIGLKLPKIGKVYVRQITLAERLEVERRAGAENAPSLIALLICAATVNEAGEQLLTLDDAAKVDKMPIQIVGPLGKAADKLNAMTDAAEEEERGNS